MKPHKYVSAIVVEPYYYYYHSVPYFESMYIAEHDMIYDPDTISQHALILDDGTRIEPSSMIEQFGCSSQSNWLIIIILLIMLIIFIYSSKKI